MRIAVNARWLSGENEGYGYYIKELFQRITKQHPEHEFLFLFDSSYKQRLFFYSNVSAEIVGPSPKNALSHRLWYDLKIPFALKRWKADVFVSLDGYCSLTTKTPQVLGIHDISFVHFPKMFAKSQLWFQKIYTPKFLKRATAVLSCSEFSKQDIIQQYSIVADKIVVVPKAAKEIFEPLDFYEREATKASYTDGREYFLFVGGFEPLKNLMNALKAFSEFKKWQHSNMKLVITGRTAWNNDELLQKIETFKFKDDVVLLDYVKEEQLAKIMASAYALLYPSLFEGFGLPVLEAMQSGTPVVTSKFSAMQEMGEDAVLYADPNDAKDIAGQMIRLYQDESLREQLILKGKAQPEKFSWESSAKSLWEVIEKVISKKDQ
jgi:glycosyltransferase involved in cell wall biosynthesis